jgi:hypothetical protein
MAYEESLLDQAREVKITPFEMTRLGREVSPVQNSVSVDETLMGKVAFADVEDMTNLMDAFKLKANDLLDNETSEKLKFIYKESKLSELPLHVFLTRIINSSGGRLQENLLGRVSGYLGLIVEEREVAEKLAGIHKDLSRMKHANSNFI